METELISRVNQTELISFLFPVITFPELITSINIFKYIYIQEHELCTYRRHERRIKWCYIQDELQVLHKN